MNQIAHIFRKDCRRLWLIIAAVLVFTFLHGYGEATNPGGGVGIAVGLSPYALLFILAALSWLVLPIALFLLVVSVIQEESLVGSDKFWLTRPYDRLILFFEKFLFVIVWAVLPMLLHDVILIRYYNFSLSSAFGLLLWKNAQFGLFLLVAATLGVLSASFARAVLLAIVAIVIAALTFSIVLRNPGGPSVGTLTTTYEILAVLAMAAVGAVCVIAFQYRFRITSVAAAIGAVVILVCALLARFWPSSLTAYLLQKNESPLLRSVQILPDADLKDIASPREVPHATIQGRTAYYPFHAVGMSDNVGVDLIGLSAHFDSPGQKSATLYLAALVRFQPKAGGSGQFADVGSPEQLVSFAPALSSDDDRLKDADGTLSGNLVFQGFRSDVKRMPIPLPRQRQELALAGRRCAVESHLRDRTLVLMFDCVELEPGDTSRFEVRLLRDNREVAPSQTNGQPSSAGAWPAFLSPILRTYYTCEFAPAATGPDSSREPMEGQELLVFAEQSLGALVRTFRIEQFRPTEFSLQAWEQRGVLRAESTGTQSNSRTPPRAQ
jgi:hypothetical protein